MSSLQKFKIDVANAVVTVDNSSLSTMDTEQVLDLFSVAPTENKKTKSDDGLDAMGNVVTKKGKGGSAMGYLQNMGDLWDESQYEEYNLKDFIKNLN